MRRILVTLVIENDAGAGSRAGLGAAFETARRGRGNRGNRGRGSARTAALPAAAQ